MRVVGSMHRSSHRQSNRACAPCVGRSIAPGGGPDTVQIRKISLLVGDRIQDQLAAHTEAWIEENCDKPYFFIHSWGCVEPGPRLLRTFSGLLY
jgi:hypothetical protein